MKRILTALFGLFITCGIYAQPQPTSEQIEARKAYAVRFAASHGFMTKFTGVDAKETLGFQGFMDDVMHCTFNDKLMDASYKKDIANNTWTLFYNKRYSGDGADKPNPVKMVYYMTKDRKQTNKVEITGDWDLLVDIYTRYWERPLRLNRQEKTGEVARLDMFGDRVTISYLGGWKGKILVTPNGMVKN